jgi:hypothetical protein
MKDGRRVYLYFRDEADMGMWATFMAGQLTHKPGHALRIYGIT